MSTLPLDRRQGAVAHTGHRGLRRTWAQRPTWLAPLLASALAAASLIWAVLARVSPELSVARLSHLLQSLHP